MKYLILFCSFILCVSCASSRTELFHETKSDSLQLVLQEKNMFMEEFMRKLQAEFRDSVHVVVREYYPPEDSDSIGALKKETVYDRKSVKDIQEEGNRKTASKDSASLQLDESSSSDTVSEVQKERTVGLSTRFYIVITLFLVLILFFYFRF